MLEFFMRLFRKARFRPRRKLGGVALKQMRFLKKKYLRRINQAYMDGRYAKALV